MEDELHIIPTPDQPDAATNPAINPDTGLIDRVPTAQELSEAYGSKARAMHDAKTPDLDTTLENANPILHSPASVGHPGPNSPWGPTELTGDYKRIPGSEDLMVQVVTKGNLEDDPTGERSKVAWVPLSQIQSGKVTWRATGGFSAFTVDLPA